MAFKPSLSDLLAQADVAQELREQFLAIQDRFTTTIHEASELTGLSESQLRYAESRGLLAPNRGQTDDSGEPQRVGQRRYSADNLLRARLISWLLDRGFTLGDILDFMDRDSSVIQTILDTKTLRLRSVLDSVDDTQFKRFSIPRLLYYSLLLIFERDAVDDVGVVWPIRATPDDLENCAPGPIRSAEDLGHLGDIFVAWRARGRPLATFVTIGNPFDRDMKLQLRSFRDVLLESAEPDKACSGPLHAYLLFGPEAERELDTATRLLSVRQKTSQQISGIPRRQANPRVVAGRLMNYVQRMSCTPSAVARRSESSLSDVLFFTSPEMVNPTLGDALLNRLANAIVELGGPKQVQSPGQSPDQSPEHRWRFSCILMPREPKDSSKREELVVRAQSAQAPHRVGVTTASPQANGGLSFRAYSSGRVTYRPWVITLDPAVSYVAEESPILSAIAAPAVDGQGLERSQPPAVLYIASDLTDSFSDDDFLLIRVMGRLVGEIVQTYNSRAHAPSALTDTLANPEVVDGDLADYLSELSFMTDLRRVFESFKSFDAVSDPKSEKEPDERAQHARPAPRDLFYENVQSLSVLGLDIDGFASIQRNRGERVARQLLRDVGHRLQQRLSLSLVNGIPAVRLYRIWSDRFYVIIRDDDIQTAMERADRLRKEMSSDYLILLDRDVSGENPPVRVVMRMMGTALAQSQIRTLLESADGDGKVCAAQVSRIVENGLKLASEIRGGDRALWWRWDKATYDPTSALLEAPPASPPTAIAG